eukprot:m.183563 g.183563  ORF g.183563 m.183563 type:complete len:542 (-) comp14693_c1_seq1:166-1791(-)
MAHRQARSAASCKPSRHAGADASQSAARDTSFVAHVQVTSIKPARKKDGHDIIHGKIMSPDKLRGRTVFIPDHYSKYCDEGMPKGIVVFGWVITNSRDQRTDFIFIDHDYPSRYKERTGREPKCWPRLDLARELPELSPTQLLDPHQRFQLAFQCFVCGTSLLRKRDVYKIKGGSIWTNGKPRTLRPGMIPNFNKAKNVPIYQAFCSSCDSNLGTYYPEPYASEDDPQRTFPCFKLTYKHERKADGKQVPHLVIDPKYGADVDELLWKTGALSLSVRVSQDTFSIAEKLRRLHRDNQQLYEQFAALRKVPSYWIQTPGSELNHEKWIERLMNAASTPADRSEMGFDNFKVLRVIPNHNSESPLWKMYRAKVDVLSSQHQAPAAQLLPEMVPRTCRDLPLQVTSSLDTAANEFLLFHGTSFSAALAMQTQGFDSRIGKDRGFLGRGTYFAGDTMKAHYYASKSSDESGVHVMFLARVSLGAYHYQCSKDRELVRPPPLDGAALADSVIGKFKPKGQLKKYWEYAVYEGPQTFPEFIIVYTLQ